MGRSPICAIIWHRNLGETCAEVEVLHTNDLGAKIQIELAPQKDGVLMTKPHQLLAQWFVEKKQLLTG